MKRLKLAAIFLAMFSFSAVSANCIPVNAAENISIFAGENKASAWNLAATVKSTDNGGSIDTSKLKEDGYFYVEYTGEQDGLQLILQSWSGGESWAIVQPSEVGVTKDNINYAKFDQKSIKEAYKSNLSTLDAIHVWNVKGAITLKSIDYISSKTVIPTEDNVRYLGRAYNYNDQLWLGASASGAEFTFTGTSAEVTLLGDSCADGENMNNARIGFYVNDKLVADKMITEKESTVKVFESDKPETVKITIRKLSECANGTVGIKNIEINPSGKIIKTEKKDRTIEFIGDSITCGYGVEDEDKMHHFSTATENITRTYAYKTAQALDADINVTAFSGYGIVSGYCGELGVKNADELLPEYYEKVGRSCGAFGSSQKIDELLWDFNKNQPDLIVISLGTNDTNYCNSDENKEEFTKGYTKFIKTVRAKNPNAKILCVLGIMGDSLYECVENAVDNYKSETRDNEIDCMKFDVQKEEDGFAADWHPTEKTHTKASIKLTEKIKEFMKW